MFTLGPTRARPTPARARALRAASLLVPLMVAASCASQTHPPASRSRLGGPQLMSSSTWSAPGPSTVPSFYEPPSPLAVAAPGTVIRYQQITGVPGFPRNATLWRILYHSRDISGHDIAVSGYVAVPTAPAPPAGRPIIAWAHGTTGVARTCAPSLFSKATDASGIYLAPDISQYIASGYVVAATDYQGLGGPGIHPYLVGQAEGQNVLDAARAAIRLPGSHASHTVVIVGHSQGGHAALFAGQLAPSYAPDLDVVGTVAIAPLTETSAALPLAEKVGETALLSTAAYAWAHTYPDLTMSDFFQAGEISTIDQLMSSTCENQVSKAIHKIPAADLLKSGFASNPALKTHLIENSPGAVRSPSPILILQGTGDTTIPDILAETFESQQCPAVGDNLALRLYAGANHSSVLTASSAYMLSWIHDRLSGVPAAKGCSSTNVA